MRYRQLRDGEVWQPTSIQAPEVLQSRKVQQIIIYKLLLLQWYITTLSLRWSVLKSKEIVWFRLPDVLWCFWDQLNAVRKLRSFSTIDGDRAVVEWRSRSVRRDGESGSRSGTLRYEFHDFWPLKCSKIGTKIRDDLAWTTSNPKIRGF